MVKACHCAHRPRPSRHVPAVAQPKAPTRRCETGERVRVNVLCSPTSSRVSGSVSRWNPTWIVFGWADRHWPWSHDLAEARYLQARVAGGRVWIGRLALSRSSCGGIRLGHWRHQVGVPRRWRTRWCMLCVRLSFSAILRSSATARSAVIPARTPRPALPLAHPQFRSCRASKSRRRRYRA